MVPGSGGTSQPARLVAIQGPLQSREFELAEGELTIGRDGANGIRIPHLSVSRFHGVVRSTSRGFELTDTGSSNGVFVNDRKIESHILRHGDLVSIGLCRFCFLEEGSADDARDTSVLGDSAVEQTMVLPADGTLDSVAVGSAIEELSSDAGARRSLNTLLQFSAVVSRLWSVEEIRRETLRWCFQLVPAERAGLLLLRPGGEEAESSLAVRRSLDEAPLELNRDIADKALGQKVGLIFSDLLGTSQGELGKGEFSPSSRSMMCAPLLAHDRPLGVLIADSGRPDVEFEAQDLRLLMGLGAIASTALENALHIEWLESERRHLDGTDLHHGMVGRSAAMREVFAVLSRVAPTETTVLIRGESGTGKELAARAIHVNSARAGRPFMIVNCATLSSELLESELFGHEKGAFTGAISRKRGRLEVADSGTVFLDEVGELAPRLQAKLLRVLEERRFERVGATASIAVDIRVIAATNRDLEKAIETGSFREDLYYRLDVVSITLPPLRDRRSDIEELAAHFVALHGRRLHRPELGISDEALAALRAYDWPGNVRELSNSIERAVVLSRADRIQLEDLPQALSGRGAGGRGEATRYHEALNLWKGRLIVDAAAAAGGNITEAAQALGLHPNYLHRLIKNLGLREEIAMGRGR